MMTLEEIETLPGNTSSERMWREIAAQVAQSNIYLKQLVERTQSPMSSFIKDVTEPQKKAVSTRAPLMEK